MSEYCMLCGQEVPCGCCHPVPVTLNSRGAVVPMHDDARMPEVTGWQLTALEYATELQVARERIAILEAELARLAPPPSPTPNPFREFPTDRRRIGG